MDNPIWRLIRKSVYFAVNIFDNGFPSVLTNMSIVNLITRVIDGLCVILDEEMIGVPNRRQFKYSEKDLLAYDPVYQTCNRLKSK